MTILPPSSQALGYFLYRLMLEQELEYRNVFGHYETQEIDLTRLGTDVLISLDTYIEVLGRFHKR